MKKIRSWAAKFTRMERKVLVWWIRYAQDHRYSKNLPIVLFLLLFMDAFVMVIPSMLLLIGATMISPQRWWLFGILFGVATACNNAVTYQIGRMVPPEVILHFLSYFEFGVVDMTELWNSARAALKSYGPFATFVGAIMSLPTQFITALIGIADARSQEMEFISSSFWPAILYAFLGHTVKSFVVAGLTRFGWVKLEKKFAKDAPKLS